MARPPGLKPAEMGVPAVSVAVSIGVTVPDGPPAATQAVWPFGVMATPAGKSCTPMVVPTVLDGTLIVVSCPGKLPEMT